MAEHKKLRASFEDIQNIVQGLQQQLQQAGQMLMQLQRGMAGNGEALAAVISVIGENLVQDEMNRMRKERQDAMEKQQADGVKQLIDAGVLVPAEVSDLTSFIVGTDTMKDGRVVRVQFEVEGVAEQERKSYVGLKAGSTVVGPQATLTVAEVYSIDKAKGEEFAKEQQKKFAAAQAAAAAPAAPVTAEVAPVEVPPAADGTSAMSPDAAGAAPEALADASGPQAAGPAPETAAAAVPEPTPAQ